MKYVISIDGKNAVLTYADGFTFSLYHSEGKVMDLVLYFTLESIPKEVSLDNIQASYTSSLEDTNPMAKVA